MAGDSAQAKYADFRSRPNSTADRILSAAKHLLATEGFEALTLEAIAAEAKVNKAATRYHYGSKDGLIEAIVEEIVLSECSSISVQVDADATDVERIDVFMEAVRRVATEAGSFGGFFDILPHALRTEALRARLEDLYETWYAWNVDVLGLRRAGVSETESRALGQLMSALVDGIAVQVSLHGAQFDPEPMLAALRRTLELHLKDLPAR